MLQPRAHRVVSASASRTPVRGGGGIQRGRFQVVRADGTSSSDRKGPSENPIIVGLVSAMTESLRLLGVGRDRYEQIAAQPAAAPVAPGDLASLMGRIRGDFGNAYIVTGIIDSGIYDEDCYFADPTVAFSGLDKWKRNLQLLTPFLVQPKVGLLEVKEAGQDDQGRQLLQSRWTLETWLALPWQPRISVIGETTYTLSADARRVERHVERWNVSGAEALMQMVRPSSGPPQEQRG